MSEVPTVSVPVEVSLVTPPASTPVVVVDAPPVVYRSMTRSASIARLGVAMATAQGSFLTIEKDKTAKIQMKAGGQFSYKFADLASCLASVRPALAENGLALFQPVHIDRGSACATTMLVHGASGEWISADYHSAIGDMQDAKSVGSAATYARRYGLLALLAIAPDDEDDDGAEAAGKVRGAAQGFERPNVAAQPETSRTGARNNDRDAMRDEAPPAEPYDIAKDLGWHQFLGNCKGDGVGLKAAPLNMTPDDFIAGWIKRMAAAKTKADLGPYAAWVAAGTGNKSPTVRAVTEDMKAAYDAAIKRVRDEQK